MDLLVISSKFLASLVIVSLLAWGVVVWRGIRRHWMSAAGFGLLAVVLSVATVADFVNACIDRKPVQPTFEDGLKNQMVLAAVEESVKSGKWVKV